MALDDARLHSPAVARNREPILEVLRGRMKPGGRVLEVASGTGEHAAFLAPRLRVEWQPSDVEPPALRSIDAWSSDPTVRRWVSPSVRLDVTEEWPPGSFEWIYSANMIHIAPFEATQGLFSGAGQVLVEGGQLVLYGPFLRDGVPTAPSNLSFDQSLRARDARFGIRHMNDVDDVGARQGLVRIETVEMPANNVMVFYRRRHSGQR